MSSDTVLLKRRENLFTEKINIFLSVRCWAPQLYMREKFVTQTLLFFCQHDVERYYLTWWKNLFTERSMVSSTMVLLYKGDKFVHRKNKYFVFLHTAARTTFLHGRKNFHRKNTFLLGIQNTWFRTHQPILCRTTKVLPYKRYLRT